MNSINNAFSRLELYQQLAGKLFFKSLFLMTLVFMTIVLLSSCQTRQSQQVVLTPLLQLTTDSLTTGSSANEWSLVQKVTGVYQGRKQSFIAQLEINQQGLIMVGLTEFGGRLFSLTFDNQNLVYESGPLLKTPMNAGFLLSDLQLIYWPKDIIERVLTDEYRLIENRLIETGSTEESQNGYQRVLIKGQENLITITYSGADRWRSKVEFQDHQKDYQLSIETLQITAL